MKDLDWLRRQHNYGLHVENRDVGRCIYWLGSQPAAVQLTHAVRFSKDKATDLMRALTKHCRN